ncbi:MAG: hypothetical protein WCB57_10950 [Pseudonocardiaceae bacterium]
MSLRDRKAWTLQHQAVASHRAEVIVEGSSRTEAGNILGSVSWMRHRIRPQRGDQIAMVVKLGEGAIILSGLRF